ncbi:unnamed protein product, partial [marine sediment metagenome]
MTKRILLVFLFLIAAAGLAAGDAPPADGLYVEAWPNGKKKLQARYRAGELHGTYTEYHENGKSKVKANYSKGKLHGPYKEYAEDGKLRLKCSYKDGELHGSYQKSRPNGKTELKTSYANGELHGKYVTVGEDGKIVLDQIYLDGVLRYPKSQSQIRFTINKLKSGAKPTGPLFDEAPSAGEVKEGEDGEREGMKAGKVSQKHLDAALA